MVDRQRDGSGRSKPCLPCATYIEQNAEKDHIFVPTNRPSQLPIAHKTWWAWLASLAGEATFAIKAFGTKTGRPIPASCKYTYVPLGVEWTLRARSLMRQFLIIVPEAITLDAGKCALDRLKQACTDEEEMRVKPTEMKRFAD